MRGKEGGGLRVPVATIGGNMERFVSVPLRGKEGGGLGELWVVQERAVRFRPLAG